MPLRVHAACILSVHTYDRFGNDLTLAPLLMKSPIHEAVHCARSASLSSILSSLLRVLEPVVKAHNDADNDRLIDAPGNVLSGVRSVSREGCESEI